MQCNSKKRWPTKQIYFSNTYAATFSISKNYLFGYVSALTVSCMLTASAVALCSAVWMFNAHFAGIATIWMEQNLTEYKKKPVGFWKLAIVWPARERNACISICICRICGWVRFSNDSSRSLLLLNFYFFTICIAVFCGTLLAFVWIEKSNVTVPEFSLFTIVWVFAVWSLFVLSYLRVRARVFVRVSVLSWLCTFSSV